MSLCCMIFFNFIAVLSLKESIKTAEMTSVAVPNRKPHWRPSSVGIGSSLTLSGGTSKPLSHFDKEWSQAIPSKPFCFPKVGTNEKKSLSTSKVVDCWKSKLQ